MRDGFRDIADVLFQPALGRTELVLRARHWQNIGPRVSREVHARLTDTADSEAGRVEAAWNAVRNLEEKSFWRQGLESRLDP